MKKILLVFVLLQLVLVLFNINYGMRKSSESNECKCNCGNISSGKLTKDEVPLDLLNAKPRPWLSREASTKLGENECAPPILNPFDPNMIRVFRNKFITCNNFKNYFKLVGGENGDSSQEILMVKAIPEEMKCCYSSLGLRDGILTKKEIGENEAEICELILRKRTKVPNGSQFIYIKCGRNVECGTNCTTRAISLHHQELLISFPQPSPSLLESKARLMQNGNDKLHPRLNIIAIGFDHVSRMSFIRQMNHSFKYLRSELKAIDLHGFNKIADTTLDNVLGFLMGYDFRAVVKNRKWWNPDATYFDKLPFIWKNFSRLGYITSLANDYNSVFTFSFKGFKRSPTDYYINSLLQGPRQIVPHRNPNSSKYCFGKELGFDILQQYAIIASGVLVDHPYFQFIWNSLVSQAPLYASMADHGLLKTLRHFRSIGILNKSLVIVWSDHGARRLPVMKSRQARIESKMPFAFLLLPEWFKDVYPKAYENLRENQYRLTTVYDIHSTLEDMLNPGTTLSNEAISKPSLHPLHLGVSLFRPIPKNRTCENVGIDEVWCACSAYEDIISSGQEDITESRVHEKLASFAVDTMNSWLAPYDYCEHYWLESILKAEVKVGSRDSSTVDLSQKNTFRIVLTAATSRESRPSFEVYVFTQDGWLETRRDFSMERKFMNMSPIVVRLTYYGSSHCMSEYDLQPICTCK